METTTYHIVISQSHRILGRELQQHTHTHKHARTRARGSPPLYLRKIAMASGVSFASYCAVNSSSTCNNSGAVTATSKCNNSNNPQTLNCVVWQSFYDLFWWRINPSERCLRGLGTA